MSKKVEILLNILICVVVVEFLSVEFNNVFQSFKSISSIPTEIIYQAILHAILSLSIILVFNKLKKTLKTDIKEENAM